MKPPLHDVALHHRQSVHFPCQILLQQAGLSITTVLALGTLCWQLEAAAFTDSSNLIQPDSAQVEAIYQTEKEDIFDEESNDLQVANFDANLAAELEFQPELEPKINQPEISASVSNNAVETEILEHKTDLSRLEFNEFTGESVVEDSDTNDRIAQTQSADYREQSRLMVVDAPIITTESVFDSSILQNHPLDQVIEPALMAQSTKLSASENTANSAATNDFSDVSHSSEDLANPLVQTQGVYTLQGNESSARARVSASYAITPNVMIGGTVDLTTGDAFSDSPEEGIDLNELYVAVSPTELPNLRFIVGMLDLTSYFDRNSFAKDAATHFLNPVFQSNPALTAAGLGSRPAILMNWSVADPVEVKIAGFSSDRDLGDFALDGFAGEVGVQLGNLIVRGTYITGRDAGQNSGFREIFQIERDNDDFGLDDDDREQAFGINAEYFIPEIDLGLFARYGWYENLDLDHSSSTFSVGLNLLDLFMAEDRLGLAYGQQLSNSELRREEGDDYPDVWELFYDFQITPNLRAGVTVQSINQFSETIGGFRIRADFDSGDFRRLFR